MSTHLERSSDATEAITLRVSGDLNSSALNEPANVTTTELPTLQPLIELAATSDAVTPDATTTEIATTDAPLTDAPPTLAFLLPGARLVLRCRKDWRAASVSSIEPDCVRLNVASPSGHTYRVRRPHDAPLHFDGSIPILGEGDHRACWRVSLARYDARW